MTTSSDGERGHVQVVLSTPHLASWEPKIVRVLGIAPRVGLAEALTAGLQRAGIDVDRRGRHPTFVVPWPARPVVCGRRRAAPQLAAGRRLLTLEFPLGRYQSQFVALHADESGPASVIQQSIACRTEGLPRRPASFGRAVVRFPSAELTARDGAIRELLGIDEPTTAWLEQFLAASRIAVDTTGEPSWRSEQGAVAGPYAHAGQRLHVIRTENVSVLIVAFQPDPRIQLVLFLLARPGGGAEIVTESFAYKVGDPTRSK